MSSIIKFQFTLLWLCNNKYRSNSILNILRRTIFAVFFFINVYLNFLVQIEKDNLSKYLGRSNAQLSIKKQSSQMKHILKTIEDFFTLLAKPSSHTFTLSIPKNTFMRNIQQLNLENTIVLCFHVKSLNFYEYYFLF